ncbi:MAG: phosphatidylserine decarboxylase [Candidatus Nanoarchaeia archaeon]
MRDPERKIPEGNVIVSPADGKIIEVRRVKGLVNGKKGLGLVETLASDVAKECYMVAIFMNPLNVHVNRSPIKGKILKIKHSKKRLKKNNTFSIKP